MVESMYSLMLLIVMIFGILLIEEGFVGIQSAETAHFFAIRSHIVQKTPEKSVRIFNEHILSKTFLGHANAWIHMHPIRFKQTENQLETHIEFSHNLKVQPNPILYKVASQEIQQP